MISGVFNAYNLTNKNKIMNKQIDSKETETKPELYTLLASRSLIKGKDKSVLNKMFDTFEMINGNNTMLETSFIVWKRLSPKIKHLKASDQFEIIYESTMIAYDARISAFDHMSNYKPNVGLPENGS
tara:strand:+ start:413 stop:793 length:381 start_codon:yes stop_codon:yes gene_type:complete